MSTKKIISFLLVLLASCSIFFVTTAEEQVSEPEVTTQEAVQEQVSDEESIVAIAGHNYQLVTPAQPTQSDGKIEVLEIFWYGCPHCYEFEPDLHKWLENKADDVVFRRMPGVFRQTWIPHAKAFYTAEKLGVQDKVHSALFQAIHRDHKKIYTDDAILGFIDDLDGVDGEAFRKAYNAFSVESKVKQAMRLSRAYGITGVPAIIINGKYWSSGSLAGSFPEMLKVVDVLVDKERMKAAK